MKNKGWNGIEYSECCKECNDFNTDECFDCNKQSQFHASTS